MLRSLFSRKKQQQEVSFLAPLTGAIVPLSEVPDPVFAQQVVGDGVAILPTEGLLLSPIDGKVTHLFPTHHAIGLTTDSGLEILMHIGIDTVKLKGQGFTPFVAVGDQIKAGDKLIQFDTNILQEAGCPIVTPIVITNGDLVAEKNIVDKTTVLAGQEPLMTVVLK
ncbi:glucose-specific phosphotransferase enzyme IIA component [Brevibacillus reuszeri]|uniref:Glucose-specific phosphotransferase enzyme IIA component n=1 Tax=Brevibacillus reuszeri TaxID=54915 RepID=A0A0K9YZY7_9BACL|nr:PTS glucose transporter subunit IIA [Brevibacillus reuszeri]KNB74221.1 PTS glucose transporter subunit IIA [Brevibacillus reuszeri]MED1859619.1 PTS glucose transporter subunit IIA [Brevibacillus reuszeri]GED73002.1 glucose-specific phosphotransferase enzyme IIA component [Brevibacillus reuszeri]